MTRQKFLAAYRADLQVRYDWARVEAKLDRFMSRVEDTIATGRANWHHDAPSTHAAWRKIGGKGRASMKALRALPSEENHETITT